MAWFLCNYPPWPRKGDYSAVDSPIGNYSSFIWAKNLRQAKHLAIKRGIGETVMWERGNRGRPFTPPSIQLRKRRLTPRQKIDVIHGTCFLAFLFAHIPDAIPHCTLGDEGILHSVIHSLSNGWPRRRAIIRMLEIYERGVPGYWPHKDRKKA